MVRYGALARNCFAATVALDPATGSAMDNVPYILSKSDPGQRIQRTSKPMEADLSRKHHLLTGIPLELYNYNAGESNAGNYSGKGDFLCIFSSLHRSNPNLLS